MCLMLAEVELVLNISTKGIRLGSPGQAPAPRARGFNQLALTYNTLLSSQGTDAHRARAFRPDFGATFQTYPNLGRKSNRSFPAFHPRSCGTGLKCPFLPRGPITVRRSRDGKQIRSSRALAPDECHSPDGAFASAQHQPLPVDQVGGAGPIGGVFHPLVVEVSAAFLDGSSGSTLGVDQAGAHE